MKGKISNFIIFIFSLMALLISMKLFWNMGVFVDEFNTSPDVVLGGDFWLLMEWLKFGLLFVVTILSGISLIWGHKPNK
jgi:uncharacterized membrane protein